MRSPSLFPIGMALTGLTLTIGAAPRAEDLVYAAYYRPDAFDYAGSIVVYLQNDAPRDLTVSGIRLGGGDVGRIWLADQSFLSAEVRDEYIGVLNDQVAWYRVYPNPIAAGGIGEIILRLAPDACAADRHELTIDFEGREAIHLFVPLEQPAFALEYVGVGKNLDELHVYATGRGASLSKLSRVEVDGGPVSARIRRVSSRHVYARAKLRRPWRRASFHTVAVAGEHERQAVMLRALPTPPPLGIMGNLSAPLAEQYANHLFDVHIAFVPGRDNLYDALEQQGLQGAYIYYRRLKPGEKKYEPVYYDQPEAIGEHAKRPSLWAYFLEDEPDGRYHVTALPGLAISRDVERANQFCRLLDPAHPTYLQIDHGGFPRGVYLYGQVPDYICAHAYRVGTNEVVSETKRHVDHLQSGSRPRPFYYLNCGYATRGGRECEPDEMRLEVFTALARGAKSFQWYPAHGERGLLAHPRMWDAVGQMNGVLHQVLPLVSIGTPIGEPRVDRGSLLGSTILCGDRAMAVVLVNEDFEANDEAFKLNPAQDVTVRVRVPRSMAPGGVCVVNFPDGTEDVPFRIEGPHVIFSLSVEAGAVAVIYADASVADEMRRTHAACRRRFVPVLETPD